MDPDKRAQGHQADEYLRAQRRIALLFDGLGRSAGGVFDFSTRALRVLLRHATARHEFERQQKRLTDGGRPAGLPELFDLVASELPGWCPWIEEHDVPPPSLYSSRAALGRLVTHGQGAAEREERFGELARAAGRLLALGSVGRAASAVTEAERLIGDAAAPPEAVEAAREKGFGGFDVELLRAFLGTAHERACLLRVMRFFRPLQPIALLQALALEPKRERRHLCIALLELHGQSARSEALDLLRSDLPARMALDEAYVRRNLIFLLRRVPREGEDGLDEEVAVLARHAAPNLPPVIVKEAIGALGNLPGRRAEHALQALRDRLAFETDAAAPEDIGAYRERIESSLERRETAAGRRRSTATAPGNETARLRADVLPAMLFEVAEEGNSGDLVFEDASRAEAAVLTFSDGELVGARTATLSGADALYALIETYEGGSAVWAARPKGRRAPTAAGRTRPLRELVLEGLRRRDERQLATAIVPDAATYLAKSAAPRPLLEENDGLLTRDVWAAAAGGVSALACEQSAAADPYRVRRLYLHWVEEGALEEKSSD